jgi:hypothetical protein
VIPTTLAPSGAAGGDLTGTYPNPTVTNNAITNAKLADGSVSTTKIVDASVTAAKLAPGVIPTTLAPSGAAGGDLTGTYPNPTIGAGTINNLKLADGSVTNTKITDDAISTSKVQDGSITAAKLAPGVIPTSIPVSGTAGGDLTGTYPNPTVTNGAITNTKLADGSVSTTKIVDASVTAAKLAPGVIPTSLAPSGAAGGDLTGTYPNPTVGAGTINNSKLADGSVTNSKIMDDAISTSKVQDASITAAKLAPGVIPTSLAPSGAAGGDLSGTYPNPTVGAGTITNTKLADGSVSTTKIVDASVTAAKLAPGVIPTALPPIGTAGGDLSGSYPNPVINKLKGIDLSATAPTTGQVLKYNGSVWAPSNEAGGSFALPFFHSSSSVTPLFAITNTDTSAAISGTNSSNQIDATAIYATITSTNAGENSAAVRALNKSLNDKGSAISGQHDGTGKGVWGHSVNGIGVSGTSTTGYGVFGTSNDGTAGLFDISNGNSFSDAVFVTNNGYGNGIVAISMLNNGVLGIANDVIGAGVFGANNAGGEGVLGRTWSSAAAAVVGRNDGSYAGVKGMNASDNGVGVLALANVDGTMNGTALVAELEGNTGGNIAVFKNNGLNVARIDATGKGYFNNGTQLGGADVAELFEVDGEVKAYEPGDVLVISETSDRKVGKSTAPYSTLVAGVYATKPGVMLTERNAEKESMDDLVPMGVIGVIPTKVCMEGGEIKRGDLIVTSSIPGVAMKADPDKVKVGQVIGKALQNYNGSGVGKINILVSVK